MDVVIYCRFSSELQNPKSIDDQQREVKDELTRMGIDASKAELISDAAVSGLSSGREGFDSIRDRIRNGRAFILAVDDQSRLSRLNNAQALITDLVFAGGRFVSTGEHIDTNSPGWKLKVRVMELHHSTCSDETGHRVRRGQHGRIVQGLSAGDFPFGYESYPIDPEYLKAYCGRGPKPAMGIRIHRIHAKWVRWIFEQFAAGQSINAIARELTRRKAPRGRHAQSCVWFAATIRKLLGNEKYIGLWTWGRTTMVRDSTGRKKQVPVPTNKILVVERPELRIISAELWDRVQRRLHSLKERTGKKPGQPSRAPRTHFTEVYPQNIGQALFRCGHCAGKMHQQSNGRYVYRACAASVDGREQCPGRPHVPAGEARTVLLQFLSNLLNSMPGWIAAAVEEMTASIQAFYHHAPAELEHKREQLRDAEQRFANLLQIAESGGVNDVQSFGSRLKEIEMEVNLLRGDVKRLESLPAVKPSLPDKHWIKTRMKALVESLADDEPSVARLLKALLGTVRVYRITPPGKRFGYHELRFQISGWSVICEALRGDLSLDVLNVIEPQTAVVQSPEFCLQVGGPAKLDILAPRVAELRATGMRWSDIAKVTGLSADSAYNCWRRYTKALAVAEGAKSETPDVQSPRQEEKRSSDQEDDAV